MAEDHLLGDFDKEAFEGAGGAEEEGGPRGPLLRRRRRQGRRRRGGRVLYLGAGSGELAGGHGADGAEEGAEYSGLDVASSGGVGLLPLVGVGGLVGHRQRVEAFDLGLGKR